MSLHRPQIAILSGKYVQNDPNIDFTVTHGSALTEKLLEVYASARPRYVNPVRVSVARQSLIPVERMLRDPDSD